jgi:transposase-like protein
MPTRGLDFSKPNLMLDLAEVKRMFGESLNEGCRYLLKQSLEQAMALDFYHHISALGYTRTPLGRGYRNGYRTRLPLRL